MFKEVKSLQVIPSYLVQPLKASSSTHLAMSQMALLARLLRDLGPEGAGFTVDSVMRVSALGWPPQPGPSWWLQHVGLGSASCRSVGGGVERHDFRTSLLPLTHVAAGACSTFCFAW